MKRKVIALLLCFVMFASVGVPGTLAIGNNAQAAETGFQIGVTNPVETTKSVTYANPTETKEPEGGQNGKLKSDETSLYGRIMACETFAKLEAILAEYEEEELDALMEAFTPEQLAAVQAHYAALSPETPEGEEYVPPVNFTDAAPLVSVSVGRSAGRFALNGSLDSFEELANGLMLNKYVSERDTDGNYTVTLEAYAKASATPTDVILVVDQSDSMDDCLVCGASTGSTHYVYTAVDNPSAGTNYFYFDGSSYNEAYYCNRNHTIQANKHEPGWYTQSHAVGAGGTRLTPKTPSDPTGVQFYTRTSEPHVDRMDSVKSALSSFAAQVKAANSDNRIAMVGFSADSGAFLGTKLFRGSSSTSYSALAGNENHTAYASAFQVNIADINASINQLGWTLFGGSHANLGFKMANNILSNDPRKTESRNRVVILITDGSPDSNSANNYTFDNGDATTAINLANEMRNNYAATVYTVGFFTGADPSSPGSNASLATITQKYNWFAQNVSSNIGVPQTPSYFLSAFSAAALGEAFANIKNRFDSAASLGSGISLVDEVSKYFDIVSGSAAVSTAAYSGSGFGTPESVSGAPTANVSGQTVTVSGFDFDANAIREGTSGGNMLVVTFKISPKAGFLGGNGVPTNESASVMQNGESLGDFPTGQAVDVPIPDITVAAADKNVYLTNTLSDAQLLAGATASAGNTAFTLTAGGTAFVLPTGEDAWKGAYVSLTSSINREAGITTDTQFMADSTYTLTVTLTPTMTGATDAKSATSAPASMINVFKPALTFNDSDVWYGGDAPVNYDENTGSTVWKHGETLSTDEGVIMTGTAPGLSLTYTPGAGIDVGKINTKKDIPVKVDVTILGTSLNVNGHTTFSHTACAEGSGCSWNVAAAGDPAFLLHVKTCQLIITKSGGNAGEPYVFNIYKDNVKYTEASITGNGNVTIYELPVGTYTIAEDTGWSWRFPNPTYNQGTGVNLNETTSTGAITCTNAKASGKIYWLNGYSEVIKNIFGIGD